MLTLGPAVVASAHTVAGEANPLLSIAHQLIAPHHLPISIAAVALAAFACAVVRRRQRH
jgi:hypothetical protein